MCPERPQVSAGTTGPPRVSLYHVEVGGCERGGGGNVARRALRSTSINYSRCLSAQERDSATMSTIASFASMPRDERLRWASSAASSRPFSRNAKPSVVRPAVASAS